MLDGLSGELANSGRRPSARSSAIAARSPAGRTRWPAARPQQMADEEVAHPPLAVGAPHPVVGVGDDEQLEIFVGLDQRIDQPHRRLRRDVRVHLADDQEQLALEPVGVVDVGRLAAYQGPTG